MIPKFETRETEHQFDSVIMTPDMAKLMLEFNLDNNRKINQHAVRLYASDMRNGYWCDNGETIKVDTDGRLIDGQHRLLAVIMSGVSIPVTIAWGIDRSALKTIDRGKQRSISDNYKIDSELNAALMAGIVTWINRWDKRNPVPKHPTSRLSTGMAKKLLEDNPRLRDTAHVVSAYTRHFIGLCNISLIGFCHFLFSEKNPDKATEFIDKLARGSNLGENHPILKARERMRSMKSHRAKLPDYDYLATIILAWNLFVGGKVEYRNRLYWREADGNFPEPK